MLVRRWYIKAAIQGALSQLPQPQRWNRLLQRYFTQSLDLKDDYFLGKWRQCERHFANFGASGEVPQDFVALELGTGWFPIVSVGLALSGARRVYSIDIQPLVRREQLIATLEHYQRHLQSGTLVLPNNRSVRALECISALLKRPASPKVMMSQLGIELLIADARRVQLPSGKITLFVSNGTLEHIPAAILADILREFHRLSRSDAVMSHYINMADHYAGFDSSITAYNFLRFSERRWRFFNNKLHYQNRLRVSDFRRIHAEAGWKLVAEDNRSKSIEVLRSVPLASEFQHYDAKDLAVCATWMSARPG